MGPKGLPPIQGIIHILTAIKFDRFIQTKISQKFTAIVPQTPYFAILDQPSQNGATHFAPSNIAQHVLDDFSLRRVGFNFRFETGVVDFAEFCVKYLK